MAEAANLVSGRTISRTRLYGVVFVLNLLAVFCTQGPLASGRESYSGYASRILDNLPAGVSIRPDLEDVLLASANRYRQGKKLPRLKIADQTLRMAARAHAMDMLLNGFVGHRSSTGHEFEGRMRAFNPGQMIMPVMAENAARERSAGPADAEKAGKLFAQWLKSPPHRKTLGNRSYVLIATGVVQKGEALYAVQIFSGPPVETNFMRATPDAGATLY